VNYRTVAIDYEFLPQSGLLWLSVRPFIMEMAKALARKILPKDLNGTIAARILDWKSRRGFSYLPRGSAATRGPRKTSLTNRSP